MTFEINEIADAIGAKGTLRPASVSSLMIDSRSVVRPSATLFVALHTPNNDGHAYIPELMRRGVRNFVVDHIPDGCDGANFLLVDDTLDALRAIGTLCRSRIHGKVVAVTGSRGKTVTKEFIYQSLHDARRVSRSPRSFNSQIGVPLSLWNVDPTAAVVVIEAGISQPGEMDRLADIIAPEIGIITGITTEHDAGFASREQKIEEKLRLFKDADTIIYNACDPDVSRLVNAEYPCKNLMAVNIPCDDTPRCNMAYTKALLSALGFGECEASRMLAKTATVKTRLNVIDGANNCRLLIDRFTNDNESLRGALDFMRRQVPDTTRRTLVIDADSFIGDARQLRDTVVDYGIDRLIIIGENFEKSNANRLDILSIPSEIKVERYGNASQLTSDDFYDEAVMIRGSLDGSLDSLYAILEAKQHETLMEVNLDAIVHNFNFFRSKIKPSTGIICMLKAQGYGAGSVELARTLQRQGAAWLAVAVVDEGVELRHAGVTMPIMVLNPRAQNYKVMFDYNLQPEIYSFDMLDEIIRSATRYGIEDFNVHIKLETGMRRLGFLPEEMQQLATRLNSTSRVKAATLFTHLACADDPSEDDYTHRQFATFAECCDTLDSLLPEKPRRHILNSTGIIRFPEMQYDYVRLGIGLYGIPTLFDGSMAQLRNVSSLTSPIISIKHWKAGDSIGYNRRGMLRRDSVIATVPVGYADGLDRYLGNGNTSMLVNGTLCPTIGNICMDICMIDVTGVDCKVGDRVEIFGDNIPPQKLADTLTTIPYEILTSISPRVKRVYYRE